MSTILRWEHVVWNVADSTGFHQSQWWYTPACWDGRLDGRPEVIWAACTSRRRPRIGRTRQSKRPTCHPRTGQSTLRSRRSGFPPIEAWNAACSVWLFQKPCTVIRVHVVDEIDELFSPSPFSHAEFVFFSCFRYSIFCSLFEGMWTNGTWWAKSRQQWWSFEATVLFMQAHIRHCFEFVDDETVASTINIHISCACISYLKLVVYHKNN